MVSTENLNGVTGIYGIIHRDSGSVYVGQSTCIGSRMKRHRMELRLRKQKTKLYNSLSKHGEDAFDVEVLERCGRDKLMERERFYIVLMDSVKNGLNLAAYPERSRFGVPQSAETNAKVSVALRGRKKPPISDEQRADRSRRQTEVMKNQAIRYRISASVTGFRHTPEAKEKIAQAQLKPIIQMDINGRRIAKYKSVGHAAFSIGRNARTLRVAAQPGTHLKTAYGSIWKYTN